MIWLFRITVGWSLLFALGACGRFGFEPYEPWGGGVGGSITGAAGMSGGGGGGTGGSPGPLRFNPMPSTNTVTNSSTLLGISTDVPSTCRYSNSAGVAYSTMTETFAVTGGTVHQQVLTDLTDDTTYSFYVRCRDGQGGTNDDDHAIVFTVDLRLQVVRSVGPGQTSALATGTGLVISGGIATFPSAVPDRVGIGDVIEIDATPPTGPEALASITGRIDAQTFFVRTTDGLPFDDVSDASWSIFRAYTGLKNAFEFTENTGITASLRNFDPMFVIDTVARDRIWNIACYADDIDVAALFILADVWATGPEHPLNVFTPVRPDQVGISQRHNGVWTPGAYILQNALADNLNNTALSSTLSYMTIDGLQIDVLNHGPQFNLGLSLNPTSAGEHRVSNTIIRGHRSSTAAEFEYLGTELLAFENGTLVYTNNIVYGFRGGASRTAGLSFEGVGTLLAVNNTFADNKVCVTHGVIMINNITYGCDASVEEFGEMEEGSGFNATNAASWVGTPTGTGNRVGVNFSFVSAATDDYRLGPLDEGAVDLGTASATGVPDTDIQGEPRVPPVDVGADERHP